MVYELLHTGKDNPTTGSTLARVLRCSVRDVVAQIERERRDGKTICASVGENPGYYIAADAEELDSYCEQLKGRAIEMFKTRQALLNARDQVGAGA